MKLLFLLLIFYKKLKRLQLQHKNNAMISKYIKSKGGHIFLPFHTVQEINPEYSLEGLMLKLKLQDWPPDTKRRLIWKDPDAGKDWRQEEKGMTEDEIAGWHHWLNEHEFEQALGDGEGQGSLECWSPLGRRDGHDWVTK